MLDVKTVLYCGSCPDWVEDRDLCDEDWVQERWGDC